MVGIAQETARANYLDDENGHLRDRLVDLEAQMHPERYGDEFY